MRVEILTRSPTPGRVKTRLIPALGAERAAALHAAMVHETLRRVAAAGLEARVHLDGDLEDPFARGLMDLGAALVPQASGDLGDRILAALSGPGRALVLGTDCVAFEPAWLQRAAASPAPVVIGPAEDGGYWTLAVERAQPELFQGVPWSTDGVLAATMQAAGRLGLKVETLPTCYDIDTPADLDRLRRDPACPPSLWPALGRS